MKRKKANGNAAVDPGRSSGEAANCPFCAAEFRAQAIAEFETVFAVPDARPITQGHLLVVPLRHAADFFAMSPAERRDADELLRVLRERVLREDPTVTGFNVGTNCGASAGQRVMHAHIHLIPRRDREDGRTVKGVIRRGMSY